MDYELVWLTRLRVEPGLKLRISVVSVITTLVITRNYERFYKNLVITTLIYASIRVITSVFLYLRPITNYA